MPAADVYRALWRHRVMILLLTAIAGAAAYGWTRTQQTIYQADALVRIQQRATSPADAYGSVGSLELGERLAQTYARIVETRSMQERVARALTGTAPAGDISISATPVGSVELLTISAQSHDPDRAAVVANATTVALGRFIKETGTLRDQIVVVDRATAPTAPAFPRTTLTVALAVLLALLFNSVLALALEFFADRLPAVENWEERLGRPVLANVPDLQLKTSSTVLKPPRQAATAEQPVAAEAMAGPTRWSVGAREVRAGGQD